MGNNGYQTLNKEIFGQDLIIEHINLNLKYSDGKNKVFSHFFTFC